MPTRENISLNRLSKILLFIVVVLVALAIYLNDKLVLSFKGETKGDEQLTNSATNSTVNIQSNTPSFNNVQNITYNFSDGVSSRLVGVSAVKDINNDTSVITYNSFVNPNISNVIIDLVDGFAISDDINIEGCINPDQLAVNYEQKTCGTARCFDRFGNKIIQGQTIEEIVYRPGLERCQNQALGYLSFNMNLTSIGTVNNDTLFLTVNNIFCGTSVYQEFFEDPNLDYYIKRDFFVKDETIDKDKIIPRLVHRPFEKNSYQQKLIIKRYDKGGTENPTGPLAEIFIRPGQLFLTAEGVSNSISSITKLNTSGSFSNQETVRSIKQDDNYTAKCIFIGNNNFYIVDGGQDYNTKNTTVYIEDDNGDFTGFAEAVFLRKNKSIVMKQRGAYEDESRAVWLLAPPLDLSPDGITKDNKITKGYIRNFSNQSSVKDLDKVIPLIDLPSYSKVNPGTIIGPIDWTNIPETKFYGPTTYKGYTEGGVLQIPKTYEPGSTLDLAYGVTLSFPEGVAEGIGHNLATITKTTYSSIYVQEKLNLNSIIYENYPTYLLKAVNKYPMFADPKSLTNGADAEVFIANITNSDYSYAYNKYTCSLEALSNDSTNQSLGNGIFLDGAVEWQEINTFSKTIAFDNDYFVKPSINRGVSAVTSISSITSGNLKFTDPVYGQIESVDIGSADYSQITLPNFTSSKIVDLNSQTLEFLDLDTQTYVPATGTSAQCILTFVTQGVSTFIETFQLIENGVSFQRGSYNLLGSGISPGLSGNIGNIQITSQDLTYFYEAVTVKLDSTNPISPSEISENNDYDITSGLVIDQGGSIINPGYNYSVGMTVYINQFDSDGESTFGTSYNPGNITSQNITNLPYVKINSVSELGVSYTPAPQPLFDNNQSLNLEYNFWEDSPGIYSPSPQQIIFYGDFIGVSLPYLGDPVNNLKDFLLDNKLGDSVFTNIEFLTSLQIPSYYYKSQNYPNTATLGLSQVQNYEGLQLKRFIPYRQFVPPIKKDSETIPVKEGNILYQNQNYCQFVPYGLDTVYRQSFANDYTNLPSF